MTQVLEIPIDQVKPNPENARTALRDIDTLAASIDRVGLIEPLIVKAVAIDGRNLDVFMVLAGHRRLAALQKLGRQTVQAICREQDETTEALAAIADNTAVVELTPTELAAAVGRLDGFELTDQEIAQALDIVVEDVTDARAIHKAPAAAKKVLDKVAPPSLEQAAALARFADDEHDLRQLLQTIEHRPNQLQHTIAQIDADRDERAKVVELEATMDPKTKAKLTSYGRLDDKAAELSHLRKGGSQLTVGRHEDCPGHVWFVSTRNSAPKVEWACKDWRKYGHDHEWHSSGRGATKARSSEAELEKASKARRDVIANNKAWKIATPVRRRWIVEHLFTRTRLDHVCEPFLIDELLACPRDVAFGFEETNQTLKELGLSKLAPPKTGGDPLGRRKIRVLALVVAFRETQLDSWTWRTEVYNPPVRARYIQFLKSAGYELSDVEQLILKGRKR